MCEEEEEEGPDHGAAAALRPQLHSGAGTGLSDSSGVNPALLVPRGAPCPGFCSPKPGSGHTCARPALPSTSPLIIVPKGGFSEHQRAQKPPASKQAVQESLGDPRAKSLCIPCYF